MSDPRLKTIAMGFMSSYKQLQETYSQAYLRLPSTSLDQQAAEDVWAGTFVTLNWLDVLGLRNEAASQMTPDLHLALKFVRGKVHHSFADAIEFRTDVLVYLTPMTSRPGQHGPLPIADWAWCDVAALRGVRRASSAKSRKRSGETDYTAVLAGRQVRATLDPLASLAAQLYAAL